MEEFYLINKKRNRVKRFKKFQSNIPQTKKLIEIAYGCVYKSSSQPIMKGSRVESIEDARKEYKILLEEGWKRTSIFNHYL
tara:strand:+ start:436 stop:678 length:243 start_codon:yes stop_codon:yes gene_type:complete